MSKKKTKNMPLKTRHIYHNYKSLSSFKKWLKTTGYFLSQLGGENPTSLPIT